MQHHLDIAVVVAIIVPALTFILTGLMRSFISGSMKHARCWMVETDLLVAIAVLCAVAVVELLAADRRLVVHWFLEVQPDPLISCMFIVVFFVLFPLTTILSRVKMTHASVLPECRQSKDGCERFNPGPFSMPYVVWLNCVGMICLGLFALLLYPAPQGKQHQNSPIVADL